MCGPKSPPKTYTAREQNKLATPAIGAKLGTSKSH